MVKKETYQDIIKELYLMATAWICAAYWGRITFYRILKPSEDLIMLLAAVIIFSAHYLSLWYGHKKHLLAIKDIRTIRNWDYALYGVQLGVVIVKVILSLLPNSYINYSIGQLLPTAIVDVIALTLRLITSPRILAGLKAKQESDPSVPAEPDSTDSE